MRLMGSGVNAEDSKGYTFLPVRSPLKLLRDESENATVLTSWWDSSPDSEPFPRCLWGAVRRLLECKGWGLQAVEMVFLSEPGAYINARSFIRFHSCSFFNKVHLNGLRGNLRVNQTGGSGVIYWPDCITDFYLWRAFGELDISLNYLCIKTGTLEWGEWNEE